MHTAQRIDPDFARDVLSDLYRYRHKRVSLARLSWLFFGLFGGHRFYVGRTGSALLMMFTFGGAFLWWMVDGFLVGGMVRAHNEEQERRRAIGLPPLELAFMPELSDDVLRQPPAWTYGWRLRGAASRSIRMMGDVLVLVVAGVGLGSLSKWDGAEEAVFAILAVLLVTAAGSSTDRIERFPGGTSLVRWSHRVRLFYYYNQPSSPLGLLFRPVTGLLTAPFRRRHRAEVKLYLQLGFAFTLGFLLLDLIPHLFLPLFRDGLLAVPSALIHVWVREAPVTFAVTYAFATPIGAVLTLYLLTQPTHTIPRLLCGMTLVAILLGAFAF